jgi:hypothetical protein
MVAVAVAVAVELGVRTPDHQTIWGVGDDLGREMVVEVVED